MNEYLAAFYNHLEFIFAIGYFSEIIMILIVFYLLISSKYYEYLGIYVLGFYVNTILNTTLKHIIREPRPTNPIKFLANEHFSKHSYGMPSGHSQSVFYSMAYIYLVLSRITQAPFSKFAYLFILFGMIGLIMIFERLHFHNHTMLQLAFGAGIGSGIAYLTFVVKDYFTSLHS